MAGGGRKLVEIQQSQKVDGSEFAIPCRRAADSGSHCNIRPEEFGDFDFVAGDGIRGRQLVSGSGAGAEGERSEERLELAEGGPAMMRIARVERGTTKKVAEVGGAGIGGDAAPEEGEDFAGAVIAIDGSAAELEDGSADGLIGAKVEFLLTVVTELPAGG